MSLDIQGVFFNWDPPKNHKYGKKLEYLNWDPPKSSKYGKKLKYPNWDPQKCLSMENKLKFYSEFQFFCGTWTLSTDR